MHEQTPRRFFLPVFVHVFCHRNTHIYEFNIAFLLAHSILAASSAGWRGRSETIEGGVASKTSIGVLPGGEAHESSLLLLTLNFYCLVLFIPAVVVLLVERGLPLHGSRRGDGQKSQACR
ncbi:hypothetical protein B0T14DRAFT_510996 [Immersiella caudata]|uniref:Uncharacterized protein n=1 Tax=Immersiella caudata TaxID=314043 RepID=A0AA39X3T8_9PEZI|nr:hypothetical protein B0T14DRAFT_510996 [Immersiella caudata]